MKAVYMAIVILASVMAYGFANADSLVLDDYYTEYASTVLIQKAHKIEKREDGGWNCYPYGDQTVGYYRTEEEYQNAYDPAIFAQD